MSSPSSTFAPGDLLTLGIEIDNIGRETSAAFSVTYYASVNQQISPSDTDLGADNRPALGAGNSDNYTTIANLPNNISPGPYFIGGIINIVAFLMLR